MSPTQDTCPSNQWASELLRDAIRHAAKRDDGDAVPTKENEDRVARCWLNAMVPAGNA